jgi:glycosyltransferase involved in cell wall biosynthesis
MISVIVPVYNVEAFLPNCLESIAAQSLTDFEVILVDDGSTDASGRVCDDFCARDHRFSVIHQANQGASGARNTGLKEAKGDYIYFIDGDDYLAPDTLEVLYTALSSGYDLSMIDFEKTCQLDTDFECGHIGETAVTHSVETGRGMIETMLGSFSEDSIKACVVWNKLYPKSLIQGLSYKDISDSEDVDFNYRVYLRVGKLIHIKQPLYFYMQRTDSITGDSNNQSQRYYNRLEVYHDMLDVTDSSDACLRGLVLKKLYRTVLSSRHYLKNTSRELVAKDLYSKIFSETRDEFYHNRTIAFIEKAQFFILWRFPFLMNLYLKYSGN